MTPAPLTGFTRGRMAVRPHSMARRPSRPLSDMWLERMLRDKLATALKSGALSVNGVRDIQAIVDAAPSHTRAARIQNILLSTLGVSPCRP